MDQFKKSENQRNQERVKPQPDEPGTLKPQGEKPGEVPPQNQEPPQHQVGHEI